MIYKEGEVTFDINARESPAKSTKIQFFTQDTGSAKLSFSFTKDGAPLPLSAVDAKIVLLYADDSFYKRSLALTDKVNGKAEYVLSDEELKHYGQVRAEIKLYYTNGQAIATVYFTFFIAKTLEDQNIVPVAEYYIDDVESFRAGLNKTMDEISQTVEELKAKFADLENIETKDGAQEKADTAEQNAKKYTDDQAASKTDFESHKADAVSHITADERKAWNAKETPSGAQAKADAAEKKAKEYAEQAAANIVDSAPETLNTLNELAEALGNDPNFATTMTTLIGTKETPAGAQEKADKALSDAKAYTDTHTKNASIHVTQSDKDKWNSGQSSKITNDTGGVFVSIGDTDDFLVKLVQAGKRFGTFYSTGKAANAPSTNSTRGFFHFTATDSNGLGTFGYVIAVDWRNNVFSNYVDGNLGWQGWRRLLSDADISPAWNSATLVNGATQDTNYPLKFSVSNNVLWLRGSVGSLPAPGTVVAKFTNKPTQVIDFTAPTIGSYGSARFTFTTDGELRFDGFIYVNDATKVTRVSINEPIPLW
ncbi:phage baseplate upper protein [Bacillus glycinifermentans]|uniref:phage baseplate upper protein n=1 Tax=Bacillus glycinifermentans TaxID=1664069 RepID=UPI0019226721|nr:phage baseplate upper protein [Bacillus glycinifermentans]